MFIYQATLLWIGLFAGFLLGAWASYRLLRSELYEYVKASRRDQATIHELLLGRGRPERVGQDKDLGGQAH